MSGIVQAVIFHPWDRALYLSQTKRRKFTNMLNWRDPFQVQAYPDSTRPQYWVSICLRVWYKKSGTHLGYCGTRVCLPPSRSAS